MDITFTKVKLPYGWLGNMAPFPLLARNKIWKTSEALFQACRFTNLDIIEEIRICPSPMGAKMIAKRNIESMFITLRSPEDVDNMYDILMLKVSQHPQLIHDLLAIDENDRIIEDSTARQNESGLFWGAARQEDGSWKGNNALGKTWMRLATFLRTKGRMSE